MQYNEFHQVYTCVTGHLWLSDVFQDKHILAGGCGMTRPTGDKMAPILSLAGRVISDNKLRIITTRRKRATI